MNGVRQPGAGSSVVCFSKDVKVPVKVRRTLSSVGTSSSNRCHWQPLPQDCSSKLTGVELPRIE